MEMEAMGVCVGGGGETLLWDEKYISYGMRRLCHGDGRVAERLQK